MSPAARTVAPWEDVLDQGRRSERIVAETFFPGRAALPAELPNDLHPAVTKALQQQGIDHLFSHQAEALESAWEQTTIVTTGTASGKTLCFTLPVLEVLARDPRARALYIAPTKALAQDQARRLLQFQLGDRLRPAIYDGDTPREQRKAIRRCSNVILTNPDMLHVGILPNHRAWGDVLANLAFVVIDEAHVYRGIFGSHIANVLRRLRRAAAAYGTTPRFLLASATIANPGELAAELTGLDDVEVIGRDGSPQSRRAVAMWNPPVLDEELGTRRSALAEAAELFADLIASGTRTIAFIKSRRAVELMTTWATRRLQSEGHGDLADRIAPYRAGYTPQQRRDLERRLSSGELLGVMSTNALELGIDIGALDAAICVTFPGTVASLRQMWGRAGRRDRGLALYVAGDDALDQFFCRHPEEFLDRAVEAAILDAESEEIHKQHLLCAAHEAPLTAADAEFLGPRWQGYAEALAAVGALRERAPAVFVPRRPEEHAAGGVDLRSASGEQVAVIDGDSGEILGTVEGARAASTVHEGAIYLHMGRAYEVLGLDLQRGRAVVEPFHGDWTTEPKRESETWIERLLDRREVLGVQLSLATVTVTQQVTGYQRRRISDREVLDFVPLDLPPQELTTQALYYEPDNGVLGGGGLPLDRLLGALHATEHAQIAVLPLIAMCDRWDIGGLSTNAHPQTGGPTIFIHEGHPGGVGIARQGYREFEQLCADAQRLIAECRCKDGCPSCVQSPKCGNLNDMLSKPGALALLDALLARA